METQAENKTDAVEVAPDCADKKKNHGWDECMCGQVCEMIKAYNNSKHKKEKIPISPSRTDSPLKPSYDKSINDFCTEFANAVKKHHPNLDHPDIKSKFYSPPAGSPPPQKPIANIKNGKMLKERLIRLEVDQAQ